MAGSVWRTKLLNSWWLGSRKGGRGRNKTELPRTHSLQLDPTSSNFQYFPTVHSSYKSINGLIHWRVRPFKTQALPKSPISEHCHIGNNPQHTSLWWTFWIQTIAMSLYGLFLLHMCEKREHSALSSYKDNYQNRDIMTSFNLKYFLGIPISKYRYPGI